MIKPTVQTLLKVAKSKNYLIFRSSDMYDYNLNIWGIRSTDKDTKHFNDLFCIFYEDTNGIWHIEYFEGTTDPSNMLLVKPMNIKGCAILCEGQHKSLWSYGFHKGKRDHKALVQYTACTVYRDNDKDSVINSNLPRDTGMFGINMHRAVDGIISELIGAWSAGCQVHKDAVRYKTVFIPLIEKCVKEGNTTFTYTLINESDLPIV